MDKNFDDAKILSSSIAQALDLLYCFRVMWTRDTYEDSEKTAGTIFTIQTAAERLYSIMEELEEEIPLNQTEAIADMLVDDSEKYESEECTEELEAAK